MTECDNYREMISQMLDGELSEPQKTELMTHLAVCEDCARLYDAFAFVSSSIDEGAEPPASLRANVMNTITAGSAQPVSARKRRAVFPRLAALAACLAIVVFAAAKTDLLHPIFRAAAPQSLEGTPEVSMFGARSPEGETADSTATTQGDTAQEVDGEDANYAAAAPEDEAAAGNEAAPQLTQGVQAMDVSVIRLFSGEVAEPRREPIMTVTSEEALAAIMELLEFSGDADPAQVSGDPVFVVSVTPVEGDEYTVSVWITDGKLYCVDNRDEMVYVAAGDASDLFAMIAEA